MKITFEFDTDSENFDYYELEKYKCVDKIAMCLSEISDKVRYWYNKDGRNEIPTEEIGDTIFEIIKDNNIDLERIGY